MKDIRTLIESEDTAEKVYQTLSEAVKPVITYKEINIENGVKREYKDIWSLEEVEDMLSQWKMYREAGNLPKYLLVAYLHKFNLKNFKDKPIQDILKLALTKPLKIEVQRETKSKFGNDYYTHIDYFKVNGKEITK